MFYTVEKFEKDWSWSNRKYMEARIYIWPANETIYEQLVNRRTRPFTQWKKEIIPQLRRDFNIPAECKIRWNRRAGCDCPCSRYPSGS